MISASIVAMFFWVTLALASIFEPSAAFCALM